MRKPALRCKRCGTRFVAAPYVDGTGHPAYCPTCTVRMRHEHEEQITCGRCHKTFTAVRRDPRRGLPTYCDPCSRIVNHELVMERSSRRPSITEGRIRQWRDIAAKQPSDRRFGPATRRRCRVGWDRATHTFRGVVLELTGKAEDIKRWYADWNRATAVYEVEAATIPALAHELQRYADLGPEIRRELLRDVPPHLRDHVNPSSETKHSE